MPIERNASGHSVYIPFDGYFSERPEVFFQDNSKEFDVRIQEARSRVLEIVRHHVRPLCGRGRCLEVQDVGESIDDFANFIDNNDNRRSRRLIRQRRHEQFHGRNWSERRLRSPQNVQLRRSALFSGADIPVGYFDSRNVSIDEHDRFVDLMRWYIIRTAIAHMKSHNEIECVNGIWAVKVSVMDKHPAAQKDRRRKPKRSRQTKNDNRSYHGRPQRDRGRLTLAP